MDSYQAVGLRHVYSGSEKRVDDDGRTFAYFMRLMAGVSILRASGFLDDAAALAGGVTEWFGLPAPVVPVIFVKMFLLQRQPAWFWICSGVWS